MAKLLVSYPSVESSGFEIQKAFLGDDIIVEIIREIESVALNNPSHGFRNAEKKIVSINKLVHSSELLEKAQQYLPGNPKVVRVIVFDKNPTKNWFVTWHQDKTIAVNQRMEISGWGPWTLKDGIVHVQPELKALEEMITFRIHLDDADENNGCLRLIPGSHKFGILTKEEQDQIVRESEFFSCSAKAGDLLVMRPNVLHSSAKANQPNQRRVIHIEYSSYVLPNGLAWA